MKNPFLIAFIAIFALICHLPMSGQVRPLGHYNNITLPLGGYKVSGGIQTLESNGVQGGIQTSELPAVSYFYEAEENAIERTEVQPDQTLPAIAVNHAVDTIRWPQEKRQSFFKVSNDTGKTWQQIADKYTISELKGIMKAYGLKTTGTEGELARRYVEYLK